MNNSSRFGQVPMLKKVTEDIKVLSLPYSFGMEQVNSYLFRGEKGYTVVDTGSFSEEGISTWENLIASGMSIEKVVLTHFHIDHLGLAKWFQEKHHIPIFISNLGYREMKGRQNKDHVDYVLKLFSQHGCDEYSKMASAELSHVYDFVPDGIIEENQQVRLGTELYESIWTPGHSSDHFCFYQPEQQIMVIGDHVLEKVSPVVLIESPIDVNPLQAYFNSLEKIKDLSIKLALPGHGNIMKGLGNRLDEIKSGHAHRMNQIMESIRNEEKTAWKICLDAYGHSRFFAPLMATITRCIYLESIGKIKSQVRDGRIIYSLN